MRHPNFSEGGQIKIFDGTTEIVFSDEFIVFGDTLTIDNVVGHKFVVKFMTDPKTVARYDLFTDQTNKVITVECRNMRNPLGLGTMELVPVIDFKDKSKLVAAMYFKSLNEKTNFLRFMVTFYHVKNV